MRKFYYIFSILTVITLCVRESFCQYNDQSFIVKSVVIRQPRIEHTFQCWNDFMWRNISFTETSHIRIKKTDRGRGLGHIITSWSGILPPNNNFYVVAKNLAESEYIQCGYGTDSSFFNYSERWV